jgi:glycosyltransferase involved in cell wall biosynthesis
VGEVLKILLLGEFSGFYNNLKEGLRKLDHRVDIISSGDGWKNIGNTNPELFPNHNNKYLSFLLSKYCQIKNIRDLKNYDIVQMVSPNIFGLRFNFNARLIKHIKKNNKKLFLSVAGDHYYIYKIAQKLKYSHLQGNKNYDNIMNRQSYITNNNKIVKLVDGIIPICYTYAEAYRNSQKLLKTIPLPINTDKIKSTPQNIKNNKIKIFHGLNREEAKGTKYIKEAMIKLKEKYPNDVEILIDGKMPLDKYLKVLEETNVVIDQALSYGYGMNALYSMAMGKVVLSGNEPETQKEFGRTDIPVINILPSVEDIYNKLEKLVLDKKSVIEIGEKSRLFVEDFHYYVKIAQKYVDTWNSIEVRK